MNSKARRPALPHLIALVAALLSSAGAAAQTELPVLCDLPDGSCYQIVLENGIDWDTARDDAEGLFYNGIRGRLATITSFEEDMFIREYAEINNVGKELWVGGFQADGSTEPGEGWQWINEEGSFPGVDSADPYANWDPDEPNDQGQGGVGEQHLGIGLEGFSLSGYGWNDEVRAGNIGGYVVEYARLVQDASQCSETCGPPGLELIADENVEIDPDATISFTTFFIDEPLSACGSQQTYTLTKLDGSTLDLVRPHYLCGYPRFAVVVSETNGVSVPFGVVEAISKPEEFGLTRKTCEPGDPLDLVGHDVFSYQGNNPWDNVPGHAEELTYDCSSSRGRFRGGSILPIGWYYYYAGSADVPPTFPGNTSVDVIEAFLVERTRFKLENLLVSIDNAAHAGAIRYGNAFIMKLKIKLAIKYLDKGRYGWALYKVKKFLRTVDYTRYDEEVGANFNYNGEHVARGSNLVFMLEEKIIPAFE